MTQTIAHLVNCLVIDSDDGFGEVRQRYVETMFRHDAGVMLYVPMRTAIYEGRNGCVHFSIDQPSSRLASFGDSRIAETGRMLDAKLAALLRLIPLPVPAELEVDA